MIFDAITGNSITADFFEASPIEAFSGREENTIRLKLDLALGQIEIEGYVHCGLTVLASLEDLLCLEVR